VLAAALAVIAERVYFYFRICRDDPDEIVAAVARHLNHGDADAARAAIPNSPSPSNALLRIAVGRHLDGYSHDDVRQGVDEASLSEVPRYMYRLDYLAMFANVATLAGLLGTIFGLQHSFSSLAIADASEKAALLAAGISQAMNTTAFGLMVAIPCMIAHSRLASRRARLMEQLDAAITRVLNYLEARSTGTVVSPPRVAADTRSARSAAPARLSTLPEGA
jgi:biopolymer transport protein ExbB/TolQ